MQIKSDYSDPGSFKIAFISPPLGPGNLKPLLLQNRQFKFSFSDNVRIFPLIPAHFITNCRHAGFDILFYDSLVLNKSWQEWVDGLKTFMPDLAVIETKAPVIEIHARFIKYIKTLLPDTLIMITGDHVTAFPKESLVLTGADIALPGGDWDWMGLHFSQWLYKQKICKGPEAKLVTHMPPNGQGIAYVQVSSPAGQGDKSIFRSGPDYIETPDLGTLPWINRHITGWHNYGEAYLLKPVAYILSGRGCGGAGRHCPGRCIFCVWQHTLWAGTARLRPARDVAAEINMLYKRHKIKEVFDDNESGPCWDVEWIKEFASEMKRLGLNKKVSYSCNARADSLDHERLELMKKTGFRLLKVGFESGSEGVLKKLNKDETLEQIISGIKRAKDYGLRVLFTNMVGYPWENNQDAEKTWSLARELLLYRAGFGDSLQASVCVPYPGTPLWDAAVKKGWLLCDPKELSRLSMDEKILETDVDTTLWVRKIWRLHLEPLFLIRSLFTIRSKAEIGLAFRGFLSLMGHLRDYSKKEDSKNSDSFFDMPPWCIKD